MKNILLTICGRGGSKGIPGKNIKMIAGKPLLAYTAELATRFANDHELDLGFSTDSPDILAVGERYGLPTDYVRPAKLGNDVIGKPHVIKDLMLHCERTNKKRYDYVIDLDVTSPMRTAQDIEQCLAIMLDHPDTLTVFSVSPCHRNPYFNMVEKKENGYFGLVKQSDATTRQGSPAVYDINGSIYVYSRAALDNDNPRAVTPRTLVYVMPHPCFDLDEPEDYDYLEYLLVSGKLPYLTV